MLGQYESFYEDMWAGSIYDVDYGVMDGVTEYYDFYNPNVEDYGYLYYEPSTGWYDFYNPPASDVSGTFVTGTAQSGSSLLDVIKSVLGIAAPVVTSVLTAQQAQEAAEAKAAAQRAAAQRAAAVQQAGLIPTGLTSMLSGITSSPLLLAGIGVGGYLLLKGKKSSPRRATKRRRRN